jgi:hypothetical protein
LKEIQHRFSVTKTHRVSLSETPCSEREAHFLSSWDQVSFFSLSPLKPPTHRVRVFLIRKNLIIILVGILETIFDGIQRPLKTIAELTKSVFVPRGIDVPSLDQDREYLFQPNTDFKIGDLIVGGDFVGKTFENDLFSEHRIMLSPKLNGRIVEVFP